MAAAAPWKLRPFDGVGPLRFGMTREEVHDVLGPPDRARQDREEVPAEEDYFSAGVGLVYSTGGRLVGVEANPQREVFWDGFRVTGQPVQDFREEIEGRGVETEWDEVEETLRVPGAGLQLYAPSQTTAFTPRTIQGVLCESHDYAEVADKYA